MLMTSNLLPEPELTRRDFVGRGAVGVAGAGLALTALPSWAAQDASAEILLRQGGGVAVFRHALAPGTFDARGFRLGDCSTQRNLSDDGRVQARRIGEWFTERQLQPDKVLSSPWCRCVDTATLAFNASTAWAALGSPYGAPETTGAAHLRELRKALVTASARSGTFQVWVTHSFVQSDLASDSTRSGEALIVRAQPGVQPQVLARWPTPT